jgi:acyl dehydratase
MKTIGPGYYWNDLEVGFTFRTLNRTITESDLVGFINTTGMLEMIFIDQTFAHKGGIKGRVVPAALPYALMEGLLCQTVQQMTGLALLEIEKKVLKPTLVGDTIHSEVEVVAIKPTSRGNRAVVTTMNNIVNQRGDTVISYKAVRMMAGRAPGSKSDR